MAQFMGQNHQILEQNEGRQPNTSCVQKGLVPSPEIHDAHDSEHNGYQRQDNINPVIQFFVTGWAITPGTAKWQPFLRELLALKRFYSANVATNGHTMNIPSVS